MSDLTDDIGFFLSDYDTEDPEYLYDSGDFYRRRYQMIKEAAERIQSPPDIDPDICADQK